LAFVWGGAMYIHTNTRANTYTPRAHMQVLGEVAYVYSRAFVGSIAVSVLLVASGQAAG